MMVNYYYEKFLRERKGYIMNFSKNFESPQEELSISKESSLPFPPYSASHRSRYFDAISNIMYCLLGRSVGKPFFGSKNGFPTKNKKYESFSLEGYGKPFFFQKERFPALTPSLMIQLVRLILCIARHIQPKTAESIVVHSGQEHSGMQFAALQQRKLR